MQFQPENILDLKVVFNKAKVKILMQDMQFRQNF